ncbi:hypothetical protein D3C72_1678050 [compost metagenome]
MYLNGLNSGTMLSQAALANAGSMAGRPATPAKRANVVMPTIGEIRTSRSGLASLASSRASSVCIRASAPPLENPTRCNGRGAGTRRRASRTARRVAAAQSSQCASVRPPGTVPWPGIRMAMAT